MPKIKKLDRCPCGRIKVMLDGKECWVSPSSLQKAEEKEKAKKKPPVADPDDSGNDSEDDADESEGSFWQ